MLIDVALIINKSIRGTDLAGRYGGEEFMVIFPDTALAEAYQIAERIRQAIEDYNFVGGLRISISGGVSQYDKEGLAELVHSADSKLYTAKRSGKNQIVAAANLLPSK